jgi:hypothetical protein
VIDERQAPLESFLYIFSDNNSLFCYFFGFRTGKLHLNSAGLCAIRTKSLLEYWQIDELLLGKL